jgi:ribosomal protein L11
MSKNKITLKNIEDKISAILELPVEVTIRGEREFTISTESVSLKLKTACQKYFGSLIKESHIEHDKECGSYFYFTV